MSINLLETVQKNLGYLPLHKIDTVTQEPVSDHTSQPEHKFSQAAIPAVLTALYRYVQSDAGAADFLQEDPGENWLAKIFHENTKEAIETISAYAKQSNEDPVVKINQIAEETVRVVKSNLPADADIKQVKLFFSAQRNNTLLYLPPVLKMGSLLNDDTLDDTTNKMEGPVSSLIKSIGAAFSTPVTQDEIKTQ